MRTQSFFRILVLAIVLVAGIWLWRQNARLDSQTGGIDDANGYFALASGGDELLRADVGDAALPATVSHAPVSSHLVDLADVPTAGVTSEINRANSAKNPDWRGGLENQFSPLKNSALRQAAADLPAQTNVQNAALSAAFSLTRTVNFDGMDINDCCGGSGATVPPDPDIAAGKSHLITVVNDAFDIYSTAGAHISGPFTFQAFFASVAGCNSADDTSSVASSMFDPNVLYDEQTDRYIIAIDRVRLNKTALYSVDGSHYCMAVSATNNPTGQWRLYAFPLDLADPSGIWLDFPHAGVGNGAIFMGGNMFRTGASQLYEESRVWAFPKADLYAGNSVTPAEATVGLSFTPQPAKVHGYDQGTWPPASAPHYFLTSGGDVAGSNRVLFSWKNPLSGGLPQVVGMVDINAAAGVNAGFPVATPQLGGDPISGNDLRPLDLEYRNGFLWTAATVGCNPGSGTVNCVRWAQIDPISATIVQAGTYGSPGQYRSFPDLAVDACGTMAIGYTKGSASTHPSVYVASRLWDSPAGMLDGEQLLKAGELVYTAFDSPNNSFGGRRWGDYTGMTIAPDGKTFYYVGQYSKNTGNPNGRWGTYIGAYEAPSCSAPPPPLGAYNLYLPIIAKSSPFAPPTSKAGYWRSTEDAREFYVSADESQVLGYTIFISVPGCGNYAIQQPTTPIVNDQFSFGGNFPVEGTFTSPHGAQGRDQLISIDIPGCGIVSTGGWLDWYAGWLRDGQPAFTGFVPAQIVAPSNGVATPGLSIQLLED